MPSRARVTMGWTVGTVGVGVTVGEPGVVAGEVDVAVVELDSTSVAGEPGAALPVLSMSADSAPPVRTVRRAWDDLEARRRGSQEAAPVEQGVVCRRRLDQRRGGSGTFRSVRYLCCSQAQALPNKTVVD